jgi:predicted ribosomally synthesized peptide with nif11-like leader
MSVESLKEYGKLCTENEEVRKHAKEIGISDLDGHAEYGKSLGLEFSKEDFAALAKEAGLEGKNELSERDLKRVAGGIGTATLLVVAGIITSLGFAAGGIAAGNQPGW